MNILFLAHRIPYPPDRGDKIRSWNILKHLGTLGRVHLACFADDEADAAHLPALRRAMGGSLGEAHVEIRSTGRVAAGLRALQTGRPVSLTAFDSARLRGFVDGLLARGGIDAIFVFSGQMAQFVPASPGALFVMDFGDMDSAKFAEYAQKGGALRWVHAREADKLFAFERATAARADCSLFVSDAEAALFRHQAALPGADIRSMQNGIDLDFYDPAAAFDRGEAGEGPLIAFTGQMDYRPNVEAVVGFAEEAMPLILERRPDARFAIVGRNPAPAVQRLAGRNGTVVTGSVADVRSWVGRADVVVAPLRMARGIQNKVLEAMAMARPVVASPAAFEGIDAEPGRHLLVADTPHEQAKAVLSLIADPARADALGAEARRRMESHYRWEAKLAPLADMLRLPRRKAAA